MSSNSVPINNELFRDAQSTGEIVPRSAARQIEYWMRVGKAMEEAGLSMAEIIEVLRGDLENRAMNRATGVEAAMARDKAMPVVEFADADRMWFEKRARKAKDMQNVKDGKTSGSAMGWFSAKRIKQIKLIDSPY